MLEPYTVVRCESGCTLLVLLAGRWGCTASVLDTIDPTDGVWAIKVNQPASIVMLDDLQVGDDLQWPLVNQAQGIPWPDVGVVLRGADEGGNLVEAALRRRREFSSWELRRILRQAQYTPANVPCTREAMLAKVIEHVFGSDAEDVASIKELYSRPAPVKDDPGFDPEVLPLHEEMAMSDQVSAGDLKAW